MKRILIYFILISAALATPNLPEIGRQEVFFDQFGWVHIIIRDLSTLVYDTQGYWECEASITTITQEEYLKVICTQAAIGDKLRLFARLSRHWIARKKVWEGMGITKEQYDDWLLTGVVKSPEELEAIKNYVPSTGPLMTPAELIADKPNHQADLEKTRAEYEALAEINDLDFYISFPGDTVIHRIKSCINCKGGIRIGVSDILNMGGKQSFCPICTEQ